MQKPKIINSISEIVNEFDTFFLDQWGVLHDGVRGYKSAINCIIKLKKLNKNLIIVSNSSKKKQETISRLKPLGYNKNYFIEVMTSGEMIWQELNNPKLQWSKKLGKNCYHLGEKNKSNFFDDLKKSVVNKLENTDFVLGTTVDNSLSLLEYVPSLKKFLEYKLPFICANPDYESVEKNGNKKNYCMGTIAKLYESLGGKVYFLGKPSKNIYDYIFLKFPNLKKNKVIAVGDSLPHDIKGAKNFGIKSILITSGIHKEFFKSKETKWNSKLDNYKELSIKPDFICKKFIY